MGGQKGFTIIELMIALVIFLITIAAIYETFHYQQQVYQDTESRVALLQEARAGQFFLAQDIKMAGYDPTLDAETGFMLANVAEIKFSMDLNGDNNIQDSKHDSDPGEIIRFALADYSDTPVVQEDGVCASGSKCRLTREWCTRTSSTKGTVDAADTCSGLQPVAEKVDALEFCYVLDDMTTTLSPSDTERARITSIIVSALFRAGHRTNAYHNRTTYLSAAADSALTPRFDGTRPGGWGPYGDPYRRKLFIFEVKTRNMGMNPYSLDM